MMKIYSGFFFTILNKYVINVLVFATVDFDVSLSVLGGQMSFLPICNLESFSVEICDILQALKQYELYFF